MSVGKLRPVGQNINQSINHFEQWAIHVNTNRFGSLVCSFYKLVSFVVFKELSHIFHLPTLDSVVIFQPHSLEILVFNTTESNSNHLVCSKQRKRSSNTSFGRNDPSSKCLNWFRRCLMIVYCLCMSLWRCLIVHWMLINSIFKWIYTYISNVEHVNGIHNDVNHWNGKYALNFISLTFRRRFWLQSLLQL